MKTREVKKEVKKAEVLEVEVVKEEEVVKEKSDEDKAWLTHAKAFKSDPKSRASSTKFQKCWRGEPLLHNLGGEGGARHKPSLA